MCEEKRAPKALYEYFSAEGIELFCYGITDSTNKRAREQGQIEGRAALFIADGQTEGRGRLGRSFFSPDGTGLYMTLLTEAPKGDAFALMTSVAAVTLREGISRIFDVDTDIKWVNDLYLDGKKVAGILAESFVCEDKRYVALGMGVNLTTKEYPEELEGIAGAIVKDIESDELEVKRYALAFEVTRGLLEALDRDTDGYMERYRRYSCVIGKSIVFTQNGESKRGEAVDITPKGELLVKVDGETVSLSSGEITVRFE